MVNSQNDANVLSTTREWSISREVRRPWDHVNFTYSRSPFASAISFVSRALPSLSGPGSSTSISLEADSLPKHLNYNVENGPSFSRSHSCRLLGQKSRWRISLILHGLAQSGFEKPRPAGASSFPCRSRRILEVENPSWSYMVAPFRGVLQSPDVRTVNRT